MFWNGSRKAATLGSLAFAAFWGKNGVIQICGRAVPNSRTPKSRRDDTVTHRIGSLLTPIDCWNGAQRPHALVSPSPTFALASSIAGAEPSALITNNDAFGLS